MYNNKYDSLMRFYMINLNLLDIHNATNIIRVVESAAVTPYVEIWMNNHSQELTCNRPLNERDWQLLRVNHTEIGGDDIVSRALVAVSMLKENKEQISQHIFELIAKRLENPVPLKEKEIHDYYSLLFSPQLESISASQTDENHPAFIIKKLMEAVRHQDTMLPTGRLSSASAASLVNEGRPAAAAAAAAVAEESPSAGTGLKGLSPEDFVGQNATYFIKGDDKENLWVFKTFAGDQMHKFAKGILPGGGVMREQIAYSLNHNRNYKIPCTVLVELRAGNGSLQLFRPKCIDLQNIRMNITHKEIYDRISERDLHNICLFDLRFANTDRHGGNILVGHDGRLIPIDHGGILSASIEDPLVLAYLTAPALSAPASLDFWREVANIDIERDKNILAGRIEDTAIKRMIHTTELLKQIAKLFLDQDRLDDRFLDESEKDLRSSEVMGNINLSDIAYIICKKPNINKDELFTLLMHVRKIKMEFKKKEVELDMAAKTVEGQKDGNAILARMKRNIMVAFRRSDQEIYKDILLGILDSITVQKYKDIFVR